MAYALIAFIVLGCIGCTQESENTENMKEHSKSDKLGKSQAQQRLTRHPILYDDELGYAVYTDYVDGKISLIFEGVPPSVQSLSSAPNEMEPMLKRGRWLVLVYAAYSVRDVRCIGEVIEAAVALNGQARIGVRGFYDEGEHETWCPACAVTDNVETPIWLLFEDGQTVDVRRGVMNKKEIIRWFESSRT